MASESGEDTTRTVEPAADFPSSPADTIVVTGLDRAIDIKALNATFCLFGKIRACRFAVDQNGAGRGVVHFATTSAAAKAAEMATDLALGLRSANLSIALATADTAYPDYTLAYSSYHEGSDPDIIRNRPQAAHPPPRTPAGVAHAAPSGQGRPSADAPLKDGQEERETGGDSLTKRLLRGALTATDCAAIRDAPDREKSWQRRGKGRAQPAQALGPSLTRLQAATEEAHNAYQKRIAIISALRASGKVPPDRITQMIDEAEATYTRSRSGA